MTPFGFEPRARALHPARRSGSARRRCGTRPRRRSRTRWSSAGVEYELNPGDGAFYGPKIDLHMTDTIGRSWQLGTVQLDYVMPERFEPHLHRRRQRRPPAGDDPPRADGLVRALHRHPHRALRGRVPALAGAAPGDRAARRRPPQRRTPTRSRASCGRRAARARSTTAASRSGRKIREAELAQGALHARGRRPRGGGRRGRAAPPPRGRPRDRPASRRSWSA